MKIRKGNTRLGIIALTGAASLVALVAWTGNPQLPGGEYNRFQDTIPTEKRSDDSRKPPARDLDRELQQLEEARIELKQVKEIDFEKMQREIEASLASIDIDIQKEVAQALKEVDFQKIQLEVDAAIKNIDMKQMEKEIEQAMAEVEKIDKEEIKASLEKAKAELKNIDKEEIRKSIERAHSQLKDNTEMQKAMENVKVDMEKVKKEIAEQKIQVNIDLKEAEAGIEKARTELKGYQEMIYDMESNQLLKTSEDYTIEYNGGTISVNGKNLDSVQTEKYKKYFSEKNKEIIIKKRNGLLNIEQK